LIRKLRFLLESLAFGTLLRIAGLVPRRILLGLGSLGGMLFYCFDARHRRIGLDNLAMAFGEHLEPRGARRILRACWRHFGRITLDSLAFPRLGRESVGKLVHYEGLEHLSAAYERGKGVLLFSGHFGHWELTALMQGFLGYPLALVTRPLDNPRLERLLARLRGGSGNRIIHKRNAVREILKALQSKIGVAIVIDQDALDGGIFVPFFGRPASTTPTLGLLAVRTGAAVLPTFSLPNPDGSYRIVYEPVIDWESTGNRDDDVRRLTEHCTAIIERWVRKHPELWLWIHRRWKTQPQETTNGNPESGH
jgi:KDO2-lipid IV(A) lauroyltransferase